MCACVGVCMCACVCVREGYTFSKESVVDEGSRADGGRVGERERRGEGWRGGGSGGKGKRKRERKWLNPCQISWTSAPE